MNYTPYSLAMVSDRCCIFPAFFFMCRFLSYSSYRTTLLLTFCAERHDPEGRAWRRVLCWLFLAARAITLGFIFSLLPTANGVRTCNDISIMVSMLPCFLCVPHAARAFLKTHRSRCARPARSSFHHDVCLALCKKRARRQNLCFYREKRFALRFSAVFFAHARTHARVRARTHAFAVLRPYLVYCLALPTRAFTLRITIVCHPSRAVYMQRRPLSHSRTHARWTLFAAARRAVQQLTSSISSLVYVLFFFITY